MNAAARRRRARAHEEDADPEFQVAPMVDVLLVLMIFFMSITSTEVLRNVRGVELPDAKSAADKNKKSNQIVVNLTWLPLARQSTIVIDDVPYRQADQIVPQLSKRFNGNPSLRVLIRADKGVEFSYVADVMRACSQAGIANVTFAVTKGGAEEAAAPAGGA
jgi:biopolymer transport protein ExbD